jgi:hypothetical protein
MSSPANRAYEIDLANAEMLRQSADATARAVYMAAGGDNNRESYAAYDAAIGANHLEYQRRRLVSLQGNGLDHDPNELIQHLRKMGELR